MYVCGGGCPDFASARVVQVYDLDKATWTKLPPAPQYSSQAVAINNQLVLIGGHEALASTISNMVSTWTGHVWQQDGLGMPTKRLRPGVTTYGTYVIVAGGIAEDNRTLLHSIDVLNTTTKQWSTPANLQLPRPMFDMQITVSATHICVASAGIEYDVTTNTGEPSKSVWQLPVSELEEVLTNEDHIIPPQMWVESAATPNFDSALLPDTDHLVVVGGHDCYRGSCRPSSGISVYDPFSDQWSMVCHLLEPRTLCSVVGLSRRSFLVCGGCSDERKQLSTQLSSVELVYTLSRV